MKDSMDRGLMDRRAWSQALRRQVEEETISPIQYWRGLKKVWAGAPEQEIEADCFHCESMLSSHLPPGGYLRELFPGIYPDSMD